MKSSKLPNTYICCFILFQCAITYSQSITGTINSSDFTPILHCTVTAAPLSQPSVIKEYAISSSEGGFTIPLATFKDSIVLSFSKLGFKRKIITVANTVQKLTVHLEESIEALEEVLIEIPPISQKNDTLSYHVGSFRNKSDEAIRDVIARLPGVDVTANGQIRFEGEPIENFYIEGLNLLDGKYNIANNNLPASSISKVQILENHQSRRALDSLQPSSRTSINLKLKNSSISTTLVSAGIGISPFMRDGKIVPLYFSKKNQLIGLYKTNSNGKDIKNEIEDLNNQQGFSILTDDNTFKPERLTSILPVQNPPLTSNLWFFNDTHIGSFNYLKSLKNDFQIKTNLSYVNESEKQQGANKTTFFFPENTVTLEEVIDNEYHIASFTGETTIEKNTSSIFFKNKTSVNAQHKFGKGIIENDSIIEQRATLTRSTLKNNLEVTVPLKKNALNITSELLYHRDLEKLQLNESVSFTIDDQDAIVSRQYITQHNLQLNTAASYSSKINDINLETIAGWDYLNSTLESELPSNTNGSFINDLTYINSQPYVAAVARYSKNNWMVYSHNKLAYNQLDIGRDTTNKLTYEPSLTISKKLGMRYKLNVSGSVVNTFSKATSLYNAPVLSNYRTLSRYDTPIIQAKKKNTGIGLNYKNVLSGIFNRFSVNYSQTTENRTLSNQTDISGVTTTQALDRPNTVNALNVSASLNKVFFKYDTGLKLSAIANKSHTDIFINDQLRELTTTFFMLSSAIDYTGIPKLALDYKASLSGQESIIANAKQATFVNHKHRFIVSYFPADKITLQSRADYSIFKRLESTNNNLFLNMEAAYEGSNNIKYSLGVNNIFNVDEFITGTTNTFFVASNSYKLRSRNIFFSVSFKF